MQFPAGAPQADGSKSGLIKEGSDRTFMADVIEVSREVPVLVDFWAPWCGPCKQLGPIIEKAVLAAKGAVRLVKIDTDQNPAIAGQLRIQSIPAVYAFYQGRPVDGFMGALPESQVKQFIDRIVQMAGGPPGAADLAALLEEAQALMADADIEGASALFNAVLGQDPENATAYAGVIRCLLAAGQDAEAEELLANAPEAIAKGPELAAIRTQIDLVRQAEQAGPVADLERAVAAAPDDHQARFDLAMALYAAGQAEQALDQLLDIVRRDREWNEQAARKQLVKFFEALGPKDPLTLQARRRLSSILFS